MKKIKTDKYFKVPKLWRQMITVRTQVQKYVLYRCRLQFCGAIFAKRCNLRDHFRSHTKQRPFVCQICSRAFSLASNLGRHLKTVHRDEYEKPEDNQRRSKTPLS